MGPDMLPTPWYLASLHDPRGQTLTRHPIARDAFNLVWPIALDYYRGDATGDRTA